MSLIPGITAFTCFVEGKSMEQQSHPIDRQEWTLNGDGYLFIVDRRNNRAIGSSPWDFPCVVGCSEAGVQHPIG